MKVYRVITGKGRGSDVYIFAKNTQEAKDKYGKPCRPLRTSCNYRSIFFETQNVIR